MRNPKQSFLTRHPVLGRLNIVCLLLTASLAATNLLAGVTLITHGHNGSISGWVNGMAQAIPAYPGFPGSTYSRYNLYIQYGFPELLVSYDFVHGVFPTNSDSGEIIIALDWSEIANNSISESTVNLAAALVPRLLDPGFIPELGGRPLVEGPLHLIGHSRGGSLVCEIARVLGAQGIWVDQVTTLDPHPVNNDGFSDPVPVTDATARIYENVLFADNYHQNLNFYPYGKAIPESYNRRLTSLSGGYNSFLTGSHSDVHLWYHGTIDWRIPTSDSEASLTASERQSWWTAFENAGSQTGFLFSRIARGNRLSSDQPAGLGTDAARQGYNQSWDLGAGFSPNRLPLNPNSGDWPNVIQIELTEPNAIAAGNNVSVSVVYQYGLSESNTVDLQILLDADHNSFNAPSVQICRTNLAGTGVHALGGVTLDAYIDPALVQPGTYQVYARILSDDRVRYLYAGESLTVTLSREAPRLAIAPISAEDIGLKIRGLPGQRIVLEQSGNLVEWQPRATNTLSTSEWEFLDTPAASGLRFYRARLVD